VALLITSSICAYVSDDVDALNAEQRGDLALSRPFAAYQRANRKPDRGARGVEGAITSIKHDAISTTKPIVRSGPITSAMSSVVMLFCKPAISPLDLRYGFMSSHDQRVS
jgi:hypothetical protein